MKVGNGKEQGLVQGPLINLARDRQGPKSTVRMRQGCAKIGTNSAENACALRQLLLRADGARQRQPDAFVAHEETSAPLAPGVSAQGRSRRDRRMCKQLPFGLASYFLFARATPSAPPPTPGPCSLPDAAGIRQGRRQHRTQYHRRSPRSARQEGAA